MSSMARRGGRRLPPGFTARVRAAALAPPAVVPARHSATVVLLRDGADGLEAYLLRRVTSMAFAAGMHVFPGGSVDPRDESLPPLCWAGPPAEVWTQVLTAQQPLARALVCAAVRETFEETGVLLASGPGADVLAEVADDSWEADRQALLDRSSSLAAMLTRRQLQLRADLLRPWAHWITPEIEPRRYDTRFFVAAMPAGQRTRDVGGEADAVAWLRPRDALEAAAAGEVGLLPPTAFTLTELIGYDSVAAVLAAADARDVRPVLPQIVISGEDAIVLLPGERGYDDERGYDG
jgi:8-oxo-dGTP pyrophosphatase MutT (NUDIX family)